ncbi:MAG: efflux RND transporter periplasmic adaptor subunit [Gammaproteobacteria bacterium]|nr:efflux RND transporter periplasmic adaptor subunit [Gammaproteobacteria bacterium]
MKSVSKTIVLIALSLVVGVGIGYLWPHGEGTMNQAATDENKILYYKAPMDPNYRRDSPGKSPMGMDLVPVYASDADMDDAGVVSINPRIINNLGVRTAAAKFSPLSRRIETVGYISYDEDTLHQINTRVSGWIEELATKATGDPIKRGQVLFELYSPMLVNAQEEYLAALKSSNTALHKASGERLIALGFTNKEITRLNSQRSVEQRIKVYAQSDGVVAHLGVRQGSYITPATEVMSIAKLDRVWILAEVFERQAAWVQPGQMASVELDYIPGKRWHGTVDYIYPELDPVTRTLKVRLRFDNSDQTLKPNMFTRVVISDNKTSPSIHVPLQALIRGGSVDRLVLALGDGRFRSVAVQVGIESGDRVEILAGISAGDKVVTSGQFLIDSESNVDSALARMEQTPTAAEPDAATQDSDADHHHHVMESSP